MNLDVTATNLQGTGANVRLNEVPDVCPRCHKGIHPKELTFTLNDKRNSVQALFRCTHQSCQEIFIANYITMGSSTNGRPNYLLSNVAPQKAKQQEFSETITEVSPTFIAIYSQALAAEANGLDQMVGIGIRKALEFLVKDFACNQNPEDENEIKEKMLGKCIEDYIQDVSVKACAKRAAWLGNYETHYLRKWEDKDISDLKLLVKLTVNGIDNVLLTQKYIKEMA